MKDFGEAAREHVIKTYQGTNKPDEYEIKLMIGFLKSHCKEDFIAGAEHGYSEAKKEVREFYLLVRDYFKATAYLSTHAKNTIERQLRLDEAAQCSKMILEALSSFTDQEQKELPSNP